MLIVAGQHPTAMWQEWLSTCRLTRRDLVSNRVFRRLGRIDSALLKG